ncbi:hypothetical protein Halar_2085 [halophilic archaeon DL31]|nr:hypothetical protein Halar_2085 [halophilic archaeon DL31]
MQRGTPGSPGRRWTRSSWVRAVFENGWLWVWQNRTRTHQVSNYAVAHNPNRTTIKMESIQHPVARSLRPQRAKRVGRRGSAFAHSLSPSGTSPVVLPASHTSGLGGATSKLAPVVRFQRTRYSGTTTANGFDSRPHCWGRAREHRELNRRDNPPDGSKAGLKAPARPVDGKRKPGRAHARGRGAQCRFGKAPPRKE